MRDYINELFTSEGIVGWDLDLPISPKQAFHGEKNCAFQGGTPVASFAIKTVKGECGSPLAQVYFE